MPAGQSLQAKSVQDTIKGEFDDHFLWLTEKHGRHAPDNATSKFIIRRYLLKKNPDISSSQIEKYFTSNNIAKVSGLLEKFYKAKGVLAPKKSRRKTSRKTKSPRKSPKKSASRKSAKESRRKSKSKESRGKSRRKRSKDKSSRSRK